MAKMTPEFDRRSSVVLGSPYWKIEDDDVSDERFERLEQLTKLRHAIIDAGSYDKLDAAMKILYDTAEAEAIKWQQEYDEFVRNDQEGFGRFHEVWDAQNPSVRFGP